MTQPTIPAVEVYGSLHVLPCAATKEQRAACRASDLYRLGDARLMWVNEGDLDQLLFASPRPPEQPTIAREREAVARIIITGLGLDGCDDGGISIAAGYIVADAILARPSVRDGEVERLREALKQIAACEFVDAMCDPGWAIRIARAALSASDGKEGVS